MTAVTSFMEAVGCDEAARQEIIVRINASNAERDGGRRFKRTAREIDNEEMIKRELYEQKGE